MKYYALKKKNGSVAIVTVKNKDTTIEEQIAKWPQEVQDTIVSFREVDKKDIPKTRDQRAAWEDETGGKLSLNKRRMVDVEDVEFSEHRAEQYPEKGDQLDAQYKDRQNRRSLAQQARSAMANGKTVDAIMLIIEALEGGRELQEIDKLIKTVKDANPKPKKKRKGEK